MHITFKYLCILRECVCVCVCVHAHVQPSREEAERIASRFHTVSTEPNMGLNVMNCEIMIAKIKNLMLNQLSQLGAPIHTYH